MRSGYGVYGVVSITNHAVFYCLKDVSNSTDKIIQSENTMIV